MTKTLEIGSKVHCILHGGKDGAIYNIRGEQRPETVRSIGGFMQMGGSASFDIVWEDGTESLGIPEAIIHGVQWRILDDQPNATAQELEAMRGFVILETNRKNEEKDQAQAEFNAKAKMLRESKEYACLQQCADGDGSGKLAAKNIRTQLKAAFPKVKFSVRNKHYGSIDISWTDGPNGKEVEAVTNKYAGGSFNGMEDIYEYHRTPWTQVFGSAKYISCQRDISADRMKDAARHIAFECELPLLKIEETHGHGYVESNRDSEQAVPYVMSEDNGKAIIAHCSWRSEQYGHLVRSWAYSQSYK